MDKPYSFLERAYNYCYNQVDYRGGCDTCKCKDENGYCLVEQAEKALEKLMPFDEDFDRSKEINQLLALSEK